MIRMQAGDAEADVDPEHGCRLASLRVLGHELLVTEGASTLEWGCYPMAPWAGRVRRGRFEFHGRSYSLPLGLPPHAIHGTVLDRAWTPVDPPTVYECELGPSWPFPGFARQSIVLDDARLDLRLEVHATDGAMPASCGWHPWFRRDVGGEPARLSFRAGFMEVRDGDGIPTGERVPPQPGPWDDCFGDVDWPVILSWPGLLDLSITSGCEYLVVYDERAAAVCAEPQTAPPDALNRGPAIVEPGHPLVASATWRWVSADRG